MPHRIILIIEDDMDIRNTLCTALEMEGYTVQTAQNGLEGIESLKKATPSLILLDVMMPIMDGWEFLANARARAETAKIPVIILSAKDIDIEDQEAKNAFFLKKPFDLLTLLKTIETCLPPV